MVAVRPPIGGEGPCRLLASSTSLEPTNELLKRDVQRATNLSKVKQVESALAKLVLAHERLIAMETLG